MQTDVRIKRDIEQMFVYNDVEKLDRSIGGKAVVAVTGRAPGEQIFRRDLRLIEGYSNFPNPSQAKVLASLRTVLIFGSISILILLSYSLGVSLTFSTAHSNPNYGRAAGAAAVTYTVKSGDSARSIASMIGSNPSQSDSIAREIEAVEGNGPLVPGTVLHIIK